MNAVPLRLRRSAAPLTPATAIDDGWLQPFGRLSLSRKLRAARRLGALLLWTLMAMPVQAVLLALPGKGKVWFARLYWRGFCRLLGMRVRVAGERCASGRSVLFVANHSSWVDIPVLGGVLPGCFVSKGEVANWPLISAVAKLGRTIFISRTRNGTVRELDEMRAVLARGDNIILFPEGTTSDGCRVMPFRSAFFAAAQGERPPIVQPVSVAYDRLAGLPTGRLSRALFAWVGDQDIATHYWQLAQHTGLRVTVLIHEPLDPRNFPDRKALSQAVWRAVAEGAAQLRQNRPAVPVRLARAGEAADTNG